MLHGLGSIGNGNGKNQPLKDLGTFISFCDLKAFNESKGFEFHSNNLCNNTC